MKPFIAFTALAALAAVLLAGCSGGSTFVTPAQDAEGNYVIHLTAGNKIDPANAEVPAGSTIVWVSDGTHNVMAKDGSFSSEHMFAGGIMSSGDEMEHPAPAVGEHPYECTLHAGMTGVLKVV